MDSKVLLMGTTLAFSAVLIFAFMSPAYLYAQPETYPPGSEPYGLSYGEWSAEWWKWLDSIPEDRNPAADATGAFCAENQNASGPVWFLAGTWGSKEDRSCTIPSGKSLLISPIEAICTPVDTPGVKTEEDMRKCTKEDQDKVNLVSVTVDGAEIPMSEYRFQSPLFNLTLPANNVMGVPAQETQGVSDGYFVMLKPLPKGEHEIRSVGSLTEVTVQGTQNFASDVTYHITVE
ncbi:MAG: hypothetical protein WBX01_09190 [Nitrososphaeraceae archaeon]